MAALAAGNGAGPFLSVIVPAHDAAHVLPEVLGALVNSDYPRERRELIVVDDGSHDETAVVAAEYADIVVRLPGDPRGPAYARNRGAEVARGDCVVFVDADVRVHRDTLRRLARVFRDEPDVAGVFGSYDDRPPAPGIVSRFRNLMHHYVHQQNAGDAETFWAGLGALRRDAFEAAGRYDESRYWRPQIEDIELGRRVRALGHRIVLRPEIQATHLKRWTLGGVVRTDLRHRGVPWTRLLIQEGAGPASRALNLRTSEKVCTACVAAGLAALVGAAVARAEWLLILTAVALGVVVASNLGFYRTLARCCGWWFPVLALPLHLIYYLGNAVSALTGWLAHHLVGQSLPPPAVAAFQEIGLQTWPPVPTPPEPAARAARPIEPREEPASSGGELAGELPLAFLPLHKRAFGVAVGTAVGLAVSGITAWHLSRAPASQALDLGLLAEYFYGYSVSWEGALIGGLWGFFVGFVAGWFVAFSRNLVIAVSAFGGRTETTGVGARSFLEHI